MNMPWTFLPLALIVAIPARWLSTYSSAEAPPQPLTDTLKLADIQHKLEQLSALNASLRTRIGNLSEALPTMPERAFSPGEIASAVDTWLGKRDLNAAVLKAIPNKQAPNRGPLASMPLKDLMSLVCEMRPFASDSERTYEALRESGRIDELLSGLEQQVERDPNNPQLRVALGIAYLEKLFGLGGASLEAGRLAMSADRSFDRAIELDPGNVNGRFSKAVALSNWPAFMGKTGQAIEQFEELVQRSERGAILEPFSAPYLYLGNMYLRTGNRDQAMLTWRRGLVQFPDDVELRNQIESESNSGG